MQYERLDETLSDVLYHASPLENLVNLLSKDRFFLSLSFPEKNIPPSRKYYYASFARSLLSEFFRSLKKNFAILEIDGRKLKQKYSGIPHEFFIDDEKSRKKEFEDRLVSDRPEIPEFNRYVKRAYVILFRKMPSNYDERDLEAIENTISLLEEKNIPYSVHLYPRPPFDASKLKKYEISKEELEKFIEELDERIPYSYRKYDEGEEYFEEFDFVRKLVDILHKIDNGIHDFTPYEKEIIERIVDEKNWKDIVKELNSVALKVNQSPMHYAREEYFIPMVQFMKKRGIRKIRDLLSYLRNFFLEERS